MPRQRKLVSPGIKTFPIRRFSGIETKVKPTDQKPGTLRLADGVNTVPIGSLTFGPNWQPAWGQTTLGTAIETALAGADTSKTHFVTVTGTPPGAVFLIAWDLANHRSRGVFHVVGRNDPFTGNPSPTVAISAPNNATYRNYTAGLNFYGSIVNGLQVWIGNGTDQNLVWKSGSLNVLGASIPASANDISQNRFPPCKSWVQMREGYIYGAGNVSNPLRVWSTEAPTIDFPTPEGIKTTAYSYKDLVADGTAITALSIVGQTPVAHINTGSPLLLVSQDRTPGGWKMDQRPLEANASAINPASVRDVKISPIYLGTDLELYHPGERVGYASSDFRDVDIVTGLSSGRWNKAATKPFNGDDYAIIYDEKNGRLWALMQMAAGSRQGIYCFDQRAVGITGPWRYPDIVSICQVQDQNDGTTVCGITRDGVWLWADLGIAGTMAPAAFGTALPAECAALNSPPTSDPGLPYVGVNTSTGAFMQVLNGQSISWASAWDDPVVGSITVDTYFKNARLAIIELSAEDWGIPDLLKEFANIRLTARRNSCLYSGVYMEVAGQRYGFWQATALYPDENWVLPARGLGGKITLRIVFVTFNDQAASLSSVTAEWLVSSEK